jgi:hypothetical protein
MTATTLSRPPLSARLAVEEFDARDWRKDELRAFARTLGIPSWGKKLTLVSRVRMRLIADATRTADATVRESAPHSPVPDTNTLEAEPTADASQSAPVAAARPQFFREVPGLTRSQALAAWYANRKAAANGQAK